eukprot:6203351-Pleurochrysis_carterae.AAC.4
MELRLSSQAFLHHFTASCGVALCADGSQRIDDPLDARRGRGAHHRCGAARAQGAHRAADDAGCRGARRGCGGGGRPAAAAAAAASRVQPVDALPRQAEGAQRLRRRRRIRPARLLRDPAHGAHLLSPSCSYSSTLARTT